MQYPIPNPANNLKHPRWPQPHKEMALNLHARGFKPSEIAKALPPPPRTPSSIASMIQRETKGPKDKAQAVAMEQQYLRHPFAQMPPMPPFAPVPPFPPVSNATRGVF